MSGRQERLDRWIAILCITLLALAAALVKIRSYDVWWHLEAGELIRMTGSIPRADGFSFTSAGTPWINHEWLFQVALSLAWKAGAVGVLLMKAACAAGAAAIGFAALRRGGAARGVSLMVVALSIIGLRPRLVERPEMFSLVMIAAVAAIGMDLVLRPQRPAARIAAAGVLTALWANLHAAALASPVILAALAAGAFIESIAKGGRQDAAARGARVALAAALAAAAGLLVNPYGWRLLGVPAEIAAALAPANLVNPEWVAPSPRTAPLYFCVAAVALLAGVRQTAARAAGAPPRLALLLLSIGMASLSVRQIGFFFALLPLTLDLSWLQGRSARPVRWLGPVAAAGAVIHMILAPPAGASVGLGIQPDRFPEKAADFVAARMPDARLYNDTAFGGYLIHRGYPQRRVFIDGRNEVHASLLKEIAASLDDGRRWQSLLSRHQIEAALVSYRHEPIETRDAVTGAVSMSSWSALHFPRPAWALVYWDDVAMVFVRREGPLGALAGSLEYRHIQPELLELNGLAPPPAALIPDLQRDIRRKLTDDADCRLASALSALYGEGSTSPQR